MTRTKQNLIAALAIIPLSAAVACNRSHETGAASYNGGPLGHSDANMAIKTTDGAMKLGVAHDTVYMGLSDSVLAVATNDMAKDTEESGSAFAGRIERMVKTSVGKALKTRLTYPLADLDTVTYSDGTIRFKYRIRRKIAFEDVSQSNHKALQSFSPEDAQRFVATVDSAIHTVRGRPR